MPDTPNLPAADFASAVVDCCHIGEVGALIAGIQTYSTLQSALDAAPQNPASPYVIAVRNGQYPEKIVITKPNITLIGQSPDKTILCWGDYSGKKGADGKNIGTWQCATLIIQAADFRAENLSVENSYAYLANDAKDPADPTRTDAPQAVAVMTAKGSDRAFFKGVRLLGYQDTLFTASGRSYFKDCVIAGNIDFIFGAGQVVLENCDIVSRPRSADLQGEPVGYVTAPSTQIADKYGIVFTHCRLKKESDLVPPRSTPLGRPWHPTCSFPDGRYAHPNAIGMATFIHCWMDDHISESGWDKMHGTAKSTGEKLWFQPDNPLHARFSEYGSTGPGAHTHPQRNQLSESEISDFAVETVLAGWNPAR